MKRQTEDAIIGALILIGAACITGGVGALFGGAWAIITGGVLLILLAILVANNGF
jgi:hypothetical protein